VTPGFLFIVVDHKGSSPGRTGFKMLVTSDSQVGTIGGGIMEATQVAVARELLGQQSLNAVIHQIHRTTVDESQQSGLICAGEQTMIRLALDQGDPLVAAINDALQEGRSLGLTASPYGITLDEFEISQRFRFNYYDESRWEYREQMGRPPTVYLFGAGHVGHAIARALKPLDFVIILNDHRSEDSMSFDTGFVDHRKTGQYSQLASEVPEGDNIFVVITTSSYPTDLAVLREVISKDIRYLGLMGSQAKLVRIFQELQDEGSTPQQIDRVHAPIGLDLPNETAEEIAISVVAQLISVKNTSNSSQATAEATDER
jgi:xanthine dehydrogenase accessory factor